MARFTAVAACALVAAHCAAGANSFSSTTSTSSTFSPGSPPPPASVYPRTASGAPPHIVMIIADDLGWNDISLHGSKQVPTPNIDALYTAAPGGVELAGYRVQPVCSPSRSTFLSARHSIHTGVYMPFSQGTSTSLDVNFTLLPRYLSRAANYYCAHVGKWHLGQARERMLPESRGFNTSLGYWSGAESYQTHESTGDGTSAYDFFDGLQPAVEYNNTFSTTVFSAAAVDIIESFGPGGSRAASGQPLFLYLAFQNIHWPLEAPQSYVDKYANATGGDVTRQMICAMINFLDDAVGNVTAALARAGLVEDTLLIFSSDNGGPTHGDEGTSSNNFPLRGGKNTLWEGGTRVIGIVRGAGITKTNYVSFEKVHATDWLPTLVTMASGRNWTDFVSPDEPPYQLGDGMNVWDTLSTGAPSPRDWLLLETHPPNATDRIHGDGLIVGDWKLLKVGSEMLAHADEDGWYPPPGEDPNTTIYTPISCAPPPPGDNAPDPQECVKDWCLFNITADPCEYTNVAAANPDVVAALQARLAAFSATAVPPVAPSGCDPVIQTLPNGAKVWATCGP